MKKIKWKFLRRVNCHEGFVDNKLAFSVEGTLCVTDLRRTHSSPTFVSPDHYKITSVENGKQIASDLLNGLNVELHEANRLAWIAKEEETARVIQNADALIAKLQGL